MKPRFLKLLLYKFNNTIVVTNRAKIKLSIILKCVLLNYFQALTTNDYASDKYLYTYRWNSNEKFNISCFFYETITI